MATSVKLAKIKASFEVLETLSKTNLENSTSSTAEVINKLSKELNLGSGSSPDAELVYLGTQSLSGGSDGPFTGAP